MSSVRVKSSERKIERKTIDMIFLNVYNRPHKDLVNIRKGYAFGYSYITRKSKLNAAIEIICNLLAFRSLFCFVIFNRNLGYLGQLPYIQLLRDALLLLDNIHLNNGCNNDRYNELMYNLADIFTWASWLLYIAYFYNHR